MNNPRTAIVKVAADYIGVKEVRPNWSPQIAEFWKATNYQDGAANREPWCAAFVCHVVQRADAESDALRFPFPPKSASVAGWVEWARQPKVGAVLFKPNDAKYQPEPGDIVSFLPKLSHIGIVTGTDGNDVLTIEGNTNSAGSREGDRVARKRRPLGFCGTFIRLPAVAK